MPLSAAKFFFLTAQAGTTPAVSTYGYLCGGTTSSAMATTDQITFSTAATLANTSSNLTTNRGLSAPISWPAGHYGYICGGYPKSQQTDQIHYTTGICTSAANWIQESVYTPAGLSDKTTYGYVAGGSTNSATNVVEHLTFATEVFVTHGTSLSSAREYVAGLNGTLAGYVAGGDSSWPTMIADCDKVTYSSTTFALSTVSNLATARGGLAPVSDNATYGYWAGGVTNGNNAPNAIIDRTTFSSDATAANTVSFLSSSRMLPGGVSDGTNYGYFFGGDDNVSSYYATSDQITFSGGVVAAKTVSNLSAVRAGPTGISDGAT